MKIVDDPTGRVDKAMDEMLITKRRYQHYRPQPYPHFTHNHFSLITIIINDIILNKIKTKYPTNLVMTSALFQAHS
jgi:hypothetical protein